jgi:DNA-binding PucR family transcriptional regulator
MAGEAVRVRTAALIVEAVIISNNAHTVHFLLEHDARSQAKLMPTLRSYLDHAGHKAQTVRALRVQRRTLYARLARIERILGRDLGTQDTRTRLTLAIQALDLLQDRDSGARAVRKAGWA